MPLQMELVNQPGTAPPDLGQPLGILTFQELPSLPPFEMLLPRGFTTMPDTQKAASKSGPNSAGNKADAAKEIRTCVRVSFTALGVQKLRTRKIGLLQYWHR